MAVKTMPQKHSFRQVIRASSILGGEPTLEGTRVPVRAIVLAHRRYPDIGRLRVAFPMLSAEDIAAAMAFYQANKGEIEHYSTENAMDDEG